MRHLSVCLCSGCGSSDSVQPPMNSFDCSLDPSLDPSLTLALTLILALTLA